LSHAASLRIIRAMSYAQDSGAIATPIGCVRVEAMGDEIVAIRIGGEDAAAGSTTVAVALAQIEQWFARERQHFDLTLARATSPRGAALRQAICDIGFGETASYGQLAKQSGSGSRAVGQACARNPFPLVVPCHRVLAAGGTLGAYSAGEGPATKRWLLDFEGGGRLL
jgi:methylated-DNA-[protein]-cysteine S-methyltransferase